MQIIIQAVVLRCIASDRLTVALYTERYGRITAHDASRKKQWQSMSVGDICYITLGQRGNTWFLYNYESVLTYHMQSHPQTFFWHQHILDMYFYYVPLEQPSAHLFVLLTTILKISVAADLVFKLFIIHFFCLLGYFVPESFRWYRALLAQLESYLHADDATLLMTLDVESARYESQVPALDVWLVGMVSNHDHFRFLKTQQFLPQLYSMAGL